MSETIQITIRLDQSIIEKIDGIASSFNQSRNSFIENALISEINRYLKAKEIKKNKDLAIEMD